MKDIDNKDKLHYYFLEKEKKFLYKIISFYSKKKNYNYKKENIKELMNIDDQYYFRLLSFKLNKKYSKEELEKIIENIPFRFFDINKIDSEYIIIACFPLIDDILAEIYKYIILNREYEKYKID